MLSGCCKNHQQDDEPVKIKLEYGGGYYRAIDEEQSSDTSETILTERYTFDEMRLRDFIDKERLGESKDRKVTKAAEETTSLFARRFKELFKAKVAYADSLDDEAEFETNSTYKALTLVWNTNERSIMIDYDDLVKAGICYLTVNNTVPIPKNDKYLEIDTKNGLVRVNNNTKEISVGNIIYRVKCGADKPLFVYLIEDNVQKLYVDFRVAYGWSGNEAEIDVTSNGETFTVTFKKIDYAEQGSTKPLGRMCIKVYNDRGDTGNAAKEEVYFRKKSLNNGFDNPALLLSSKYSLANWVLYQMADQETNTSKDYLIVYYPRAVFDKLNIDAPDDSDKVQKAIGYYVQGPTFDNGDPMWCCRMFELSVSNTEKDESVEFYDRFQYSQQFGWMYSIIEPAFAGVSGDDWEEAYKKYLGGKNYILPIFRGYDSIVNLNINVHFQRGVMKIESNSLQQWDSDASEIYYAPAGVSKLYGWYGLEAIKFTDNVMSSYESNSIYLGTAHIVHDTGSWQIGASVDITFDPNDTYAYLAGRERVWSTANGYGEYTGVTNQYNTIFVCYGSNIKIVGEMNTPNKGITYQDIEVLDAESKDRFTQYKEYSWQGLIEGLDGFSYFVIMFVLVVCPIVGYILLVILLGLSFLSTSKVTQFFAEKVFDPVKILTFGKRSLHDFTVKDCLVSVIVGATIFALIYKGNLLSVIAWCLKFYGQITELISKL